MPDTAVLNISNLHIDSIQVEIMKCKTNRGQETHDVPEGCTNRDTEVITKQDANGQNNLNNSNKSINYFQSSKDTDADKRKSSIMTQKTHKTFGNIFNGTGCFEGTFSLQLKPGSKPYQVPPRNAAYVLQKLLKEELEHLQGMDIITPLGIDKTTEWCNSFVLVPKANGKACLCLDPAKLNQALIRPIHKGPTHNDILPRLNNVQYMSIMNASSDYQNLKLDMQSSYLTTFTCPFGKYRYKHLPFGAVPPGNMFQHKTDEILMICQMYLELQTTSW